MEIPGAAIEDPVENDIDNVLVLVLAFDEGNPRHAGRLNITLFNAIKACVEPESRHR